jgi:predicted GIY-YIG superfamily endonuclease
MDVIDPIPTEAEDAPISSGSSRQLWLFPPARPLAERFGIEFFRGVPERPGVYVMCGTSEGVLYVGKARNLRRRLGSYRSAHPGRVSSKIRRLLTTVSRIYWDECGDEAAAIARERVLLMMLRPKFNTVGTYPAQCHYIGWRRNGTELHIGFSQTAEDWDQSYGEFTHIKPVCAALLRLVWRALHPSEQIHRLPLPLTTDSPPSFWRFDESRSSGAASLDEIVHHLDDFFRGRSPTLSSIRSGGEDWGEEVLRGSRVHSANLSSGNSSPVPLLHPLSGREGATPGFLQGDEAQSEHRILRNLSATPERGERASSFESQWIEADTLCLREFYDRQYGSNKDGSEGHEV